MTETAGAAAIDGLLAQARTGVGRLSGRTPLRSALYRLSGKRIDKRPRLSERDIPQLDTPWQDTVSGRYFGWRCRQASLEGVGIFWVEYVTCRKCNLGWVEKPYTTEEYQRRGIAQTALSVLREENPGLEWHTAGGHSNARPFWKHAGIGVPGGYRQQETCQHIPTV